LDKGGGGKKWESVASDAVTKTYFCYWWTVPLALRTLCDSFKNETEWKRVSFFRNPLQDVFGLHENIASLTFFFVFFHRADEDFRRRARTGDYAEI
jgi:hypothetical protein